MITCAEHAAEMRRVVETVEERDLGHCSTALGGIAHGARAFLQAPAEDVCANSFSIRFEQLVEAAG